MGEKRDLRKVRTETAIKKAFYDLLSEKTSFAAITIQDIADKAMINRSTFYAHYYDKYDLLEKYSSDLFSEIKDLSLISYNDQSRNSIRSQLESLFNKIFEHIFSYSAFYKVMYNELPELRAEFEEIITSQINCRFARISEKHLQSFGINDRSDNLPIDKFIAPYLSGALIGVITEWLKSDMYFSPKCMSKVFTILATIDFYGPIVTKT